MRTRTEVKKDSIVAAAASVFKECGFERASMAEIAARVGGSKATLYGYFASKEELFLAVTEAEAATQFQFVESELNASEDIATALRSFGIRFLTFVLQPSVVAAHRMVFAVAGHTEVGRAFYSRGPQTGLRILASFLGTSIDKGHLKHADTWVMAQQLIALLEAEMKTEFMFGVRSGLPERSVLEATTARAIEVFLKAYVA